jgi:hypothetical protein
MTRMTMILSLTCSFSGPIYVDMVRSQVSSPFPPLPVCRRRTEFGSDWPPAPAGIVTGCAVGAAYRGKGAIKAPEGLRTVPSETSTAASTLAAFP